MRRIHSKAVPIAPSLVAIEELFSSQVAHDWRSVAIKQAAKEFAATLHSILNVSRDEQITGTEDQLLNMVPQLVTEAVRLKHRDLLTEAIGRLAVDVELDLMPLLITAVHELRLVSQLRQAEEDNVSHL